jgi:hypothetical protein
MDPGPGASCEEKFPGDRKTQYELLRDKCVAELAMAFEPIRRASADL